MSVPFAPYGCRELAVFAAAAGALAIGGWFVWWPLAILFGLLFCFVVWFFRDPPRRVPDAPGALVSPADGTVTDITDVDTVEFIDGPARRVGIFLSIFSVHINRSPCDGQVAFIQYRKGRFMSALRPKSSSDNEANSVGLALPGAQGKVLVRQIAGAIARRIVCAVGVGDALARGQEFGMIKFGSRTEIYLPREMGVSISVKVGQKVKAGTSIIGRLE